MLGKASLRLWIGPQPGWEESAGAWPIAFKPARGRCRACAVSERLLIHHSAVCRQSEGMLTAAGGVAGGAGLLAKALIGRLVPGVRPSWHTAFHSFFLSFHSWDGLSDTRFCDFDPVPQLWLTLRCRSRASLESGVKSVLQKETQLLFLQGPPQGCSTSELSCCTPPDLTGIAACFVFPTEPLYFISQLVHTKEGS